MTHLKTLIILTLVSSTIKVASQDLDQEVCLRTGDLEIKDIIKLYPFNKSKKIKLVSFKTENKRVAEYEIPKIDGDVDLDRLFEIKALNKKYTDKLLDILINLNYDPKLGDTVEISMSMCYTPRHAILFEDRDGKVFSYIEICFECARYKTKPSNLEIGDFCYDKYALIEKLFRDMGITYGVDRDGMLWTDG